MAMREILLLQPVDKLGGEGDRVRVRAGFARNYLVPGKKALAFTAANQRQIDALVRRREERERQERERAEEIAAKLRDLRIVVRVRTGEQGKLFGSVTGPNLLEELAGAGFSIPREQLLLEHPLKTLGQHRVELRLHRDVRADLAVEIVSENPVVA
ncbi:MAG: 50S ribosomal protein L9 [Puniceicoccales bacterium]|jgi:large subunit ribosomal protein L9|nr:50S ribosomal protein L9 [Puniceicoccales bacterium]